MNAIEGLALLSGIPLVLLLAGYWAVHRLRSLGPAGRLAAALPAGLAMLLLFVAVVNFFEPLQGGWAFFCLLPCVFSLADGPARRGLVGDLGFLLRRRRGRVTLVAACAVLYLGFLLRPLLLHPDLIFYDGTSNHDSFLWITLADHLKHHPYMEAPTFSSARPLEDAAKAITGLRPAWGRMGAEGLLALTASIAGVTPLKVYIYATTALYFVWLAGVFLLLKTFVAERFDGPVLAAAVLLQPVFMFFQANSNLPNLLGALIAALLVVAMARATARTTPAAELVPWAAILVVSMHGLLCVYPEMVPFVLLPCGLLGLRAALRRRWAPAAVAGAAILTGFAVNWATTVRAVHGFANSFAAARADTQWADIFHRLAWPELPSALTTLVPPASHFVGPWFGFGLAALLVAVLAVLLAKARDRAGVGMVFTGSALLLAYTICTRFIYGWQKTVEFGGVVIGAMFPAGCIAALRRWRPAVRLRAARWAITAAVALLALFYGYADYRAGHDIFRWAERKGVLREVYALRHNQLKALNGGEVLVVPESFSMPFFQGMWAAYGLFRAHLVYSPRAIEAGGYLRPYVRIFHPGSGPTPAAVYVSPAWADSFDADSPRLVTGKSYAVLRDTNYVLGLRGFFPSSGVPKRMALRSTLTILPHAKSWLQVAIAPRDRNLGAPSTRTVTVLDPATGRQLFKTTLGGELPWRLKVPLHPGIPNRIEIALKAPPSQPVRYPITIDSLKITRQS